jgi:two-component system response regulator HupR/HoxA
MTDSALKCLLLYEWPGNVRRLANEVRRAVALADGDGPIGPELLSPEVLEAGQAMASAVSPSDAVAGDEIRIRTNQPLRQAIAQLERTMIDRAFAATGGNATATARALGVSRKGLHLKRQRLYGDDI